MTPNTLKQKLAALHAELHAANRLDPELRALLETLGRDIHALLGQTEKSAHVADLADALRAQAAKFAAQHPTIEGSLRDIADALGRMGI